MIKPECMIVEMSGKAPPLLMTESVVNNLEDKKAQRIFSEFLKSQEFPIVVYSLEVFLHSKSEERSMPQEEYKRRLAGVFFSCIAYDVLNGGLEEGDRLLSPWDTEELYASLYPAKTRLHPYGLGLQIEGITVPDGILVSEHEGRTAIKGVYEYSMTRPDNPIPRKSLQLEHYSNRVNVITNLTPILSGPFRKTYIPKAIQNRFSFPANVEVDPENFQVTFVFPKDDHTDSYSDIPGQLIFLPISGFQIHTVLGAIFQDVSQSI